MVLKEFIEVIEKTYDCDFPSETCFEENPGLAELFADFSVFSHLFPDSVKRSKLNESYVIGRL